MADRPHPELRPAAELSPAASIALLTAATVVALIPFLNKPFHIDDPLFAWAAQQIQRNPTDFFGFNVNWESSVAPMHTITQNPPLACYFLAAAATVVGWNEWCLHAVYLLPAIGTVLGTWTLARKMCRQPVLAGLAVVCSPIFLVSSTNVMCDVLMYCLWLWSIIFWRDGLDRSSWWRLALGGLLAGLAALTKYFGICLIPLLALMLITRQKKGVLFLGTLMIPAICAAAYQWWVKKYHPESQDPFLLIKVGGGLSIVLLIGFSILERRSIWLHLLWLLIPVSLLVGYEYWTRSLYGHGLITGATDYARKFYLSKSQRGSWVKEVATLSFTGGCLIALPLVAPRLLRRWWWVLPFVIAITGITWGFHEVSPKYLRPKGLRPTTWDLAAQASILTVLGAAVVSLAIAELINLFAEWRSQSKQRKEPEKFLETSADVQSDQTFRVLMSDSLLLVCWLFGTMLFAGYINWSVNGRTVLPLVSAAAILMCRQIDRIAGPGRSSAIGGSSSRGRHIQRFWQRLYGDSPSFWKWVPLCPALLLAILVAHADYTLAWAERHAADKFASIQQQSGARLWFIGHWGFQYYMEQHGGVAMAHRGPNLLPGDLVALPDNNTLQTIPNPNAAEIVNIFKFETSPWAYTQSNVRRAGFYADRWGPLPFVLGEEWYVGRKEDTMEFDAHIDTYHLMKVIHESKSDELIKFE